MSSVIENANDILAIQNELANSKKLTDLTGAERKQIENAIHPEITPGFRAWKGNTNNDYTAWQNGDKIFEIAGDDLLYMGKIIDATGFDPANTTHLNDKDKFDRYIKNQKAVI